MRAQNLEIVRSNKSEDFKFFLIHFLGKASTWSGKWDQIRISYSFIIFFNIREIKAWLYADWKDPVKCVECP